VCVLALAVTLAGCSAGVLPQIHESGGTLPVARRLLERGDLLNTVTLLNTYTTTQAGAADIDEALELLGRAHLRQRDYPAAQLDFERVLRDYPESDSAGSAAFLLGEALWGQGRDPDYDQEYTLRALQQWMDYRRDHAGHWRNPEAEGRIAEARARLATKLVRTGDLYVRIGHFEPARVYYQNALREYGETAVIGDALIGLAMVDAKLGQRGKALAALETIAREHPGTPLAERAAKARRQVERMKEGATPARRRNAPNEPPPPGVPGAIAPGGGVGP
jgi:outer membrane assembly lipoprotein YfiO